MPIAAIEENLTEDDLRDGRTRERRVEARDSVLGFGMSHDVRYRKHGAVFRARCAGATYFITAKDARHAHEIATTAGHKPTEMFMCPAHVQPTFGSAAIIRA